MTALEPAPALEHDPVPAASTSGAPALDPAVTARLAAIDAKAAQHLTPRRHTADAYAADWRAWCRFLADFNATLRENDPDGPEIPDTATNFGLFVAFVGWHRGLGLAPATIRRRVYGVVVTQRRRGITVPAESTAAALHAITTYIEDLARDKQRNPRGRGRGKATPAQIRHLRRIGSHLTGSDTLAAVRDHAVVLVGFAIGSRRSELAGLDVDDIEITDEGMIVHVRFGKSGARDDAVPYGSHPTTCPVRAVLAWIDELHLADRADGPLFLPIDRHGNLGENRMSPRAIGEIITRTGERASIGVRITGHSLRSGMATEARRAGHDVKTIAEQGGWKPGSPVLYEYLHTVDRWAENALQGIGL